MANMEAIKKRFGGHICRRCLNEVYGLSLQPEDCRYENFCPSVCPRCGEVQNIVSRVSLPQRILLYFK